MLILAIDPGNIDSAYVLFDYDNMKVMDFDKVENSVLRQKIYSFASAVDVCVIERIASYGMAVGAEVFHTCEWIGRFTEAAASAGMRRVEYILRMEEKMHICHSARAKDSNIRRALIDRFAKHDKKHGRGTKKNPDFFYGFAKDVWAAFAVAITYAETKL